jgi:hypothetical protein
VSGGSAVGFWGCHDCCVVQCAKDRESCRNEQGLCCVDAGEAESAG